MRRWAARRPRDLALAFGEQRFTWREVDDLVDGWAEWLRSAGVGSGDVVAVMMSNRPEYLFCVMALSRLRAIGSLINTNLTGAAVVHALTACGAGRIVAAGSHVETAASALTDMVDAPTLYDPGDSQLSRAIASVRGIRRAQRARRDGRPRNRDVFCYIYTSGTTGLPKAAIVRNQRMLGANLLFGRLMHRARRGDVIYVPLPLYHSNALLLGWGSALATGSAIALRERFSASAFWDDVRRHGATSFVYIGELCRYLLNCSPSETDRDHRLRVAVGNGMRVDIWVAFQERFGVPVVREFYGSTEGNAPSLNIEGRPGMIGRLVRGQAVVRCDPATGELCRHAETGLCERVSSGEVGLLMGRINPLVTFEGYVDRDATKRKVRHHILAKGDRWFDTGDLVRLHDGRWLSFEDRLGDTFRWKGENVSTTEVARTLDDADGVRESNVYGVTVPHAEGRAGMAALDVGPGFDLEAFAAHVTASLPAYQRPLFLRLVEGGLQHTGTLKQQKGEYRAQGFDPERTADPLFVLHEEAYLPVTLDRFAAIAAGELRVG